MTNKEYKELEKQLDKSPKKHEILAEIRRTNRCIGCQWNDGCPHSACYSCDD